MKDKHFVKKLFGLAIPVAFQQFMLYLVAASDAVLLGSLSQNSMAAVALAGQVQFVFGLFIGGISTGANIFASQYWGKGDKKTIVDVLNLVLGISIPVSLTFTLLAIFLPEEIMSILTSDSILIAKGSEYLFSVSLSYLFYGISQMYLSIMRNSGKAVKASIIGSACVVLNIGLSVIFIYGLMGIPKLGIKGAAYAMLIAKAIEMLWAYFDSLSVGSIKANLTGIFKPIKILQKKFWKYTSPVIANNVVWGLGFSMGSVIMGHMGADAVAASSIVSITRNLVLCFCMGLGAISGIMIGNELGAGNIQKAKLYGDRLAKFAVISGFLSGMLLLIISPVIINFSNLSPQAEFYLKWMFVITAVLMYAKAFNITTVSGIFSAGGDNKFSLICDTVTLWGIVVPLGFLSAFVFKWPVLVVYFIVIMDEFIKSPVVYNHYKKYKWLKNLTQ
ncbi:MAG: MATE family efflux transporter [Christensenellaceae bacterium]|nr:MATE family efflux transporter [Christensenellaceae bacterium]